MATVSFLGSYGDLSGSSLMFRNKIINGDMSIHQRQLPSSASTGFGVDRWFLLKINDATETVNQNVDAPIGFSYSIRNTISIGDASIGSAQYSGLAHAIEGYNIRDLSFGTSSAKSVTLQFWIKSSAPGAYTGNIGNSDATRNCPFDFTINSANTWEYKSVTLPGCTDGTWNTTNGIGLFVRFYAALGSSFLGGVSGVWNSTAKYGSGTPVNGIASNGNIFAITGVQLETGPSSTSFEYLSFQTQLAMCQRYYEKSYNYEVAPATNTKLGMLYQLGATDSVNNVGINLPFKVTKRTTPNLFLAYTELGADGWQYGRNGASGTITTASLNTSYLGSNGGLVYGSVGAAWVAAWIAGHWVVGSEIF